MRSTLSAFLFGVGLPLRSNGTSGGPLGADGQQPAKAVLDITGAGSVANPLTSDVLTTFRCPNSMSMFSLPDSGPPPGLPAADGADGGHSH